MKKLFIDTHYIDIHILLIEDNKIVDRKDIIGEKNNSCFLMPAISEICYPEELEEVIVINGPGSFTGVRLGVTIAKTIAYSLNIPIKTITYFDVLYASNNFKDGIYAIADGNGYYINKYDNNLSTNNFSYLYNKDFDKYKSENKIFIDIQENYDLVFKFIESVESSNPHGVKPIYIKLIGVENAKKNN